MRYETVKHEHVTISGHELRPFLQVFFALAIFVALSGCSRPPDLIGVDNPEVPAELVRQASKQKIFIATTRQASEVSSVFYGDNRAPQLGLASVVVSIPPTHERGNLERPKRLPPDPMTEFAVIEPVVYGNDRAFVNAINRELRNRPAKDRTILFFIHGYNNTFSDLVLRLGQFVEDTDFNGVPVLFSWASGAKPLKYVYDMNSAMIARPYLKEASDILVRTKADGVDIFAHSMGSLLTMEAIVQADLEGRFETSGRLKSVILASPDIDIDLFRAQLSQIKTKFRGSKVIFVSKDDAALSLSRTISGGIQRVGNSDVEELAEYGFTVIDLSEIENSSSGSHSKFAGSPEVVQLIGLGLNSHENFAQARTTGLKDFLVGVPIRILYD